jgi:hypothetical protein
MVVLYGEGIIQVNFANPADFLIASTAEHSAFFTGVNNQGPKVTFDLKISLANIWQLFSSKTC